MVASYSSSITAIARSQPSLLGGRARLWVSDTTELTCVTSTGGLCPSWHQSLSWKRSHPRALQSGKLDLKWASVFSSPPPNLVPFSCRCLAESRNTLFQGLFLALFQGWVTAHQCIGSCCRDSAQLVPTFSKTFAVIPPLNCADTRCQAPFTQWDDRKAVSPVPRQRILAGSEGRPPSFGRQRAHLGSSLRGGVPLLVRKGTRVSDRSEPSCGFIWNSPKDYTQVSEFVYGNEGPVP